MKKIWCLVGIALVATSFAGEGGRKVDVPSWVKRPPTSEKGVYGVGMAEAALMSVAVAAADSAACSEVGAVIGQTVEAWAAKDRENGEGKPTDGTSASWSFGHVACRIEKREQRRIEDGTFRAYALGILSRPEAETLVRGVAAQQKKEETKSSFGELDKAMKDAPVQAQE